jgi:hypothetical protein
MLRLSIQVWLATIMVSPLVLAVAIWIEEGAGESNFLEDIFIVLMMLGYTGIVYGLPSWLAFFLLISLIDKLSLADVRKKLWWTVAGVVTILVTFFFMSGLREIDRLLDLLTSIAIYYIIVFCASLFFFTRQTKSRRA